MWSRKRGEDRQTEKIKGGVGRVSLQLMTYIVKADQKKMRALL